MQLSAGWNYIYIAAGSRVRALQPSIERKIRYGVCPNKITPRSRSLLPPPRRLFSTSRASARVETFRARMRDRTYVRTREIENYNFRDGERKFGARNCTPLHRVGEVSRDRYSEHLLTDRYGPRVVPKLRFSRSVAKFSAPSNGKSEKLRLHKWMKRQVRSKCVFKCRIIDDIDWWLELVLFSMSSIE